MKNVEDIYPLSPLQQGMLFHTLYAPRSALYMEQKVCTLVGSLDVSAFQRAWQHVIDRHPALRTAFLWQGLDTPMQVVRKAVTLPWTVDNWQNLAAGEAAGRLERYLQADRERGIDPTRAPLMRNALFRVADDAENMVHEFVWTHHHILLDGWSLPLVLQEVFTFYEAYRQGETLQLPRSRPFRDYIAWLQKQDLSRAEAFWRRELRGFAQPTSLGVAMQTQRAEERVYGEVHVPLAAAETAALQKLAGQNQVTLSTVAQGAWGLLLGHRSQTDDVIFGATTSGRPTELAGVEAVVGMFINTLPVRVRILPQQPLGAWLKALQARQLDAREYEYSPLPQVQGWSDVPRGQALFHSFLVYDNYPVATADEESGATLQIRNLRAMEKGNYPLVIKVRVAGSGMVLGTLHDYSHFNDSTATELLTQLKTILTGMARQPTATLAELRATFLATERKEKMIKQRKRKQVNLNSFANVNPTAVTVSPTNLVETSYLNGVKYPLVITPTVQDVDLVDWAANSRDYLEEELLKHGAILFRGFGIHAVKDFERFAKAICPDLYGDYGDLPHEDGKVYKSTPFPKDKIILFHNESSHMHQWPRKQFFACMKAAEAGGETPLADCRKIHAALDPEITRNFEEKGLMYVRNFIEGLDVPWQQFFHTDDKAKVEEICRTTGMEWSWTANNGLRTRQLAPGVITHPKTGEKSFFNQVELHHPYFLEEELRESLKALYASADEYPRNVYYGDGTAIPDAVMAEIERVYWDTSVAAPWQEGDVIMLDNMISAHARNPFQGERKIIVALAELTTMKDLAAA